MTTPRIAKILNQRIYNPSSIKHFHLKIWTKSNPSIPSRVKDCHTITHCIENVYWVNHAYYIQIFVSKMTKWGMRKESHVLIRHLIGKVHFGILYQMERSFDNLVLNRFWRLWISSSWQKSVSFLMPYILPDSFHGYQKKSSTFCVKQVWEAKSIFILRDFEKPVHLFTYIRWCHTYACNANKWKKNFGFQRIFLGAKRSGKNGSNSCR